MRTLKKSLCLVLALVMVLGLCMIGANADYAQYTDKNEITYADAVEVLSGLGVVEGRTDGTFDPNATVTRAEACAMIARMMLGPDAADKLPVGDVKFNDVSLESWEGRMARYIAFCANRGIVVGDGNGNFRPNDPVKGTELAAMLLRALGYGAIGEYEGKGWDVNAVADALYYKVFEDSEVTDFSQKATREETALYIWNTMRVELVGYDVDLNYYDGKDKTFAGDVFGLVWFIAQIVENQATGADYTVIEEPVVRTDRRGNVVYDDDDNPIIDRVPTNLKIDTPKELIAHEVVVYYKADVSYKDKNNVRYYNAYLVQDVSTVIDNGDYVGDTYKALIAENKNNKNASLQFDVWVNYVYEADCDTTMAYDLDDELKEYLVASDMRGDFVKSTHDLGEIILDHNGEPLAYMKVNYKVDQVKKITDDGIILKLDDYKKVEYDPALAYEGIAKGDYVTVQPVGDLYYLLETSTLEVNVFERSSLVGFAGWEDYWGFNFYTYTPGYGIFDLARLSVPDTVNPIDVSAGDKVLFYMDAYGKYFATQIMEHGTMKGIVFVNTAYMKDGATDEYGEKDTLVYVQCVDQDGKEVLYPLNPDDYKTEADATAKGRVYKVYTNSKGYATLSPVGGELKKLDGKSSYLTRDGGVYYVNGDTKVYYVKGEKKEMTVTSSNALASGDYTAYGFWTGTSTYNMQYVWITAAVKAPTVSSSYLFAYGIYGGATAGGTMEIGDETISHFNFYVDGAIQYFKLVKNEDLNAFGWIDNGFYTFSVDDTTGVYDLEKVDSDTVVSRTVTLTKGQIHNGKLYLADADGVEITADVLNISSATDAANKNYLTLDTVDDIESFLNESDKNTVTVWYLATKVGSNYVPTGTIYVTAAKEIPAE